MFNTFIDSLLPGARSVRPPLIAGMLWSLLFWILLSPYIVQPADSEGWPKQFYAVINELGPVALFTISGILVFIIGAALTTISDFFALLVGNISKNIVDRWRWQRRAADRRRALEREIADNERQKQANEAKIKENETAAKEGSKQRIIVDRITKHNEGLTTQVATLTRKGLRFWVSPTPSARRIVGPAPKGAGDGLEREIVQQARREGQDSIFAQSTQPVDLEQDNRNHEWWEIQTSNRDDLESMFRSELDPDPLLALRLIDEELFLDLDRERA